MRPRSRGVTNLRGGMKAHTTSFEAGLTALQGCFIKSIPPNVMNTTFSYSHCTATKMCKVIKHKVYTDEDYAQ